MATSKIVRLILAFIAAPLAAVASVVFLAFVLWPFTGASDPAINAAFHFGVYGAVIIFPISIVIGAPAFLVFQYFGLVSRRNVLIGGVALSLVYPALTFLGNLHTSNPVPFGYWVICGVCGFVAAWVFCQTAGINNGYSQTQP